MILIAIGTGGIRAVFPPFLGDQYQQRPSPPGDGEDTSSKHEVIDYRLTLQYIYNVYYA